MIRRTNIHNTRIASFIINKSWITNALSKLTKWLTIFLTDAITSICNYTLCCKLATSKSWFARITPPTISTSAIELLIFWTYTYSSFANKTVSTLWITITCGSWRRRERCYAFLLIWIIYKTWFTITKFCNIIISLSTIVTNTVIINFLGMSNTLTQLFLYTIRAHI